MIIGLVLTNLFIAVMKVMRRVVGGTWIEHVTPTMST
jgi:hypothetical protein